MPDVNLLRSGMVAALVACLVPVTARAVPQYYDAGGVTGRWAVATTNWGGASGGPYDLAWTNANEAVFEGAGATVNLDTVTAGALTFSGGGYVLAGGALTLAGGSAAITTVSNATIRSPLSGTNGLVKAGAGRLILSGRNTYTGPTTVQAGVLQVTTNIALPGDVTVNAGGTFDVSGQVLNGRTSATIAGSGAAGTVGALANTGTTEGWVRNLTLAGPATFGSSAGKMNVASVLNGGGFALAAAGTGEKNIRMNNALTNLASITVTAGLLRLESSQRWSGPITVNTGARLDSHGLRTNAVAVILNGGTLANASNASRWTGAVTVTNNAIIEAGNGPITLTGELSGKGGLAKTGANRLILAGTGGVGGYFYAQAGTVDVTGALTAAGKSIVSGGATLNWSGVGALETAANDWAGVGDNSAGTLNLTAGSLTLTPSLTGGFFIGNVSVGTVNVSGGTLTLGNDAPLLLGGIGANANGNGTLNLSNTGRVVATGTALQQIRVGSTGNATSSGTLNLNGGTLETARTFTRVGSSPGAIACSGGTLKARGANNNWVQGLSPAIGAGGLVVDSNGYSVGIRRPLLDGGGGGGLVKQGAGTLLLTADSTYTGGTTVNGGTLAATATNAVGTGPLVVNQATLEVPGADTALAGFGDDGAGWTLNGGATVVSNVLTLTTAVLSQGRSVFYNRRVSTAGFTLAFTYSASAGSATPADGLAVVFHDDPRGPAAIGANGGSLAYATYGAVGGILASAAWGLNLYPPNTQGICNQIWSNGVIAGGYGAATGIALYGTPVDVVLVYSNATKVLTATLTQGANTFSKTYAVDLPAQVGTTTYVGLTGATGGSYAQQEVRNFSYAAAGALTNRLVVTDLTLNNGARLALGLGNAASQVVATGALDAGRGTFGFSDCAFTTGPGFNAEAAHVLVDAARLALGTSLDAGDVTGMLDGAPFILELDAARGDLVLRPHSSRGTVLLVR